MMIVVPSILPSMRTEARNRRVPFVSEEPRISKASPGFRLKDPDMSPSPFSADRLALLDRAI